MNRLTAILCGLMLGLACQRDKAREQVPEQVPEQRPTAELPATSRPTIVFLGTSITAGLGLDLPQAYPALVQRRLDSLSLPYQVINAGISGETSAGALQRIDWLLRQKPAILVIETGANDGLRGQEPAATKANIQGIIDRVHAVSPKTRMVLAGMRTLPNMGGRYLAEFVRIYPDLARANNLPFIPFILEGVGGVDSLNQADGIHPTPAGQRIVADNVWRVLGPLVTRR
ncbi:MAG: arylesterase [Gemmatimonadota bacterium]